MPSSLPFSGAAFTLVSAQRLPGQPVVRVTFSSDPLLVSPLGAHDALNPALWTVTGPSAETVISCLPVSGDPLSVDIRVSPQFVTGTWTVTGSTAIQTSFGDALSSPVAVTFVTSGISFEALSGGATQDTSFDIIRKHHNASMKGPFWDAIIAALAVGDDNNRTNAQLAGLQSWISTASGPFLDRKAGDQGVSRPADVGLSDDSYRQLTIKITARKLVSEVMSEVLEVFYGKDQTRAWVETELAAPFTLTDGQDLSLIIDEKDALTVTFHDADFQSISSATAMEVATVLTQAFQTLNLKAVAVPFSDPETGTLKVRIYSPTLGLASRVRITGGQAQNHLRFPTVLLTNAGASAGVVAAEAWVVSIPRPGIMRISRSGATVVDFSKLVVGDYVNVFGSGFATVNRGSFVITAVDVRYVAGTLTQYLETENADATAQGAVVMVTTDDMLFFRPTVALVSGASISQAQGLLSIILPATTNAVSRGVGTGAYLQQRALQVPTSVIRAKDGTVTAGFAAAHGLQAGEWLFLDGFVPQATPPAVTAGNGTTTTDATPVNTWSTLAALQQARYLAGSAATSNKVVIFGGESSFGTAFDKVDVFAVSSSAVLGNGATQYTYSRTAGAVLPMGTRSAGQAATLTDVFNSGKMLFMGGYEGALTIHNDARIYDPGANTWGGALTMAVARILFSKSILADGRILICGGYDGTATPTATAEMFVSTGASTGTFTAVASMPAARINHQQVTLLNGKVLVIGGSVAAADQLDASCLLYDPGANTWTSTGSMSYGRTDTFTATLLPDGRVFVCGGNGFPANRPDLGTGMILSSAEIYDPILGCWYPAGSMSAGRSEHQALYLPATGQILVTGGTVVTKQAELYDVATGRWMLAPVAVSALENRYFASSALLTNGTVLLTGGRDFGGTATATEYLWCPESPVFSSGGLNGQLVKIATVPVATGLTFSTGDTGFSQNVGTSISVMPATQKPGTTPGPYLWDPRGGVALSGTATVTATSALTKGQHYPLLTVASTTGFPDRSGWLCLNFGYRNQSSPIQYFGVSGSSQLILNAGTAMPSDYPVGTTVTLLTQKGPWIPVSPETLGSLYMTDSASGRVTAESIILGAKAAGLPYEVTILYPGDRGLGGEGWPSNGVTKLGDRVGIWAGNDEDEEIAAARQQV